MISNKVVPSINMLSPRVKYQIFYEFYGASVVTSYWDNSKFYTIVTEMLFHPNELVTNIK